MHVPGKFRLTNRGIHTPPLLHKPAIKWFGRGTPAIQITSSFSLVSFQLWLFLSLEYQFRFHEGTDPMLKHRHNRPHQPFRSERLFHRHISNRQCIGNRNYPLIRSNRRTTMKNKRLTYMNDECISKNIKWFKRK